MSELICCHMCHRYRKPEKMTGTRCTDRAACLKATFRATPVSVPKATLREMYGSVRLTPPPTGSRVDP